MREILFRGKRLQKSVFDDSDWVEGSFIDSGNHSQVAIYPWVNGASTMSVRQLVNFRMVGVDPDTVGQYTGLTDKNGKKIFEGDILQVDLFRGGNERCIVGFDAFQPFSHEGTEQVGFYLYWESDKQAFQKYANIGYWLRERKAICIGNIHDNPELLKGGATDGV